MKEGTMWAGMMRSLAALGMVSVLLVSPAMAQAPAKAGETSESYVIVPEDRLEIHVWKETDLTREVLVRNDGRISLPLVDDVQAAGLTPLQLKKVITEKLKEFLGEPQVSVILKVPKMYKVFVAGNVQKPGTYEMSHKITFLQAISLAGGLNEWASNKIVVISREGGNASRRVINYKDVISGESLQDNVVLETGDTIVVP
jgi:polysaccharide biosynthesis/export protein